MGDFTISGAGFVTFVTSLPPLEECRFPFPHTKKDISYTYYSPVVLTSAFPMNPIWRGVHTPPIVPHQKRQ